MLAILENDVKDKNNKKNIEAVNFLRNSHCGHDGKDPKVCCSITPTTFRSNASLSSQLPNSSSLPLANACGFTNATTNKIIGGSPAELGEPLLNSVSELLLFFQFK